jgi:translation initiation factor 4E
MITRTRYLKLRTRRSKTLPKTLQALSHIFVLSLLFYFEAWVLWEHKSASGTKDPSKWKENMNQLCAFDTVEGFWQYFNHLPRPSEVFFDGDCRKSIAPEGRTVEEYSLFKKGIEPEWGDPQNIVGGEWFCRQYFELDVLDLYWQNLVMGVVAEQIEDAVDEERTYQSYINGARVVDKSRNYPMYRLEVWVNTRDPVITERIKNRLLEVVTEGQPPSRKAVPKFDWKDHS